jgi:hypothetical protein
VASGHAVARTVLDHGLIHGRPTSAHAAPGATADSTIFADERMCRCRRPVPAERNTALDARC